MTRHNRKHGMTLLSDGRTNPHWAAWRDMKARCSRTSHRDWPDYGGRGITVCERWHIFENFYADMGEKPSSEHSIDRIDNDGNYEPGNCRWATRFVQQSNKRRRSVDTNPYIGVHRNGTGWAARVQSCGEIMNLVTYPSEHQAAAARYAKLYVVAQGKTTS